MNRSSVSEWLSRPRASRRFTMVSTSSLRPLPDEPGHGGVAGLVGGDGATLGLGVLDGLGQPDLLGHLGLLDVVPGQPVRPAAQGPHQRLVEQVLEHDRRVARRSWRPACRAGRVVELGSWAFLPR